MGRQAFFPVSLFALSALAAVPAGAQRVTRHGDVAGVVRDSTGVAVPEVRVIVTGTALGAATDVVGRFRISGLEAGGGELSFQRLGFRPRSERIWVEAGLTTEVSVVLAFMAQPLEPATVSIDGDPRAPPKHFAEFERRRKGSFGHFITREEIERQHARHLTDLLRRIPGVRVSPGSGQSGVRLRGARCPPHIWIDGTPSGPMEFNLDAIPTQTIYGVEVYSGLASVPAELMAGRGRGRCGVIVVWTRVD